MKHSLFAALLVSVVCVSTAYAVVESPASQPEAFLTLAKGSMPDTHVVCEEGYKRLGDECVKANIEFE